MFNNIEFNAIAALCNNNNGIGINKKFPWSIKEDYLYYLRVIQTTVNNEKLNVVIYGRKTWESLEKEEMPDSKCIKFVLSKTKTKEEINPANDDKIILCNCWNQIFDLIKEKYQNIIETIYVLGGEIVYEDAIKFKNFNKFYITRIFKYFECDVFIKPKNFLETQFNKIEDEKVLNQKENLFNVKYNTIRTDKESNIKYIFEIYEKKLNN